MGDEDVLSSDLVEAGDGERSHHSPDDFGSTAHEMSQQKEGKATRLPGGPLAQKWEELQVPEMKKTRGGENKSGV